MKLILTTIATLLLLVGCSKDDMPKPSYTERQGKAFALFNGVWADIQFSNIGDSHLSHLQPDPDKIVFGIHHQEPIEVYKDDYMDGKQWLFDNHGECVYHDMPYKGAEYEIIECYYYVSKDADQFRLYRKDHKVLFQAFAMDVINETKIELHDNDLSLPYIFVKQDEEEPSTVYSPIKAVIGKETWVDGEEMKILICPPGKEESKPYSFIEKVEYYIGETRIATSSESPFESSYIIDLDKGKYELSMKLHLKNEDGKVSTETTPFEVVSK